MTLIKYWNTEQVRVQEENETTALHSVGLCVLFDIVCERLNRWDSRSEAYLEEPHAFMFILGIHLGAKPGRRNPKLDQWEPPDDKNMFEFTIAWTTVSWVYPLHLYWKMWLKLALG